MTLKTGKNRIILRRVRLALLILLLSVLQNGTELFPQIAGARALLLIPAVTAVAMYEKDIAGMFYGLFAGALWDIFAAGNNFNAIIFLVVGFVTGTLMNTIMRNNIVTHFLLTAITVVLYNLGYWLYHYIINSMDMAWYVLIRYYVPDMIYTLVLAPFVFMIVRAIEKKLRTDEYSNL